MNRFFPMLLFVFLGFNSAYSQGKIKRYIHQKEYLDFSADMFGEINKHLYNLALEGKIKGYPDINLDKPYDYNLISKLGSACETYTLNTSVYDNNDTTVCVNFDAERLIILKFDKSIRQKPDFRKNVAVGLGYDSSGVKKILFYLSYPECSDKLNEAESGFLTGYLSRNNSLNLNDGELNLDSASMARDALNQFSAMVQWFLETAKNPGFHKFSNDSLNTEFTPETWQKNKDLLSRGGQNLDSDATLGIVIAESPEKNEEGIVLKRTAVGLWANVYFVGVLLPEIPVFYYSSLDVNSFLRFSSNSSVIQTVNFMNDVAKYQVIHRLSDDYRH